jgi:glycosyltransferase involved in cell wall biosynthesis
MPVTHVGFLAADYSGPPPERPNGSLPDHHFVAVPRVGDYRMTDLVRGAVRPVPFSILNYTRAEMRGAICRLLQERRFDIVLLEGVHLGEYLPLLRGSGQRPAVVCDWHNIESEILWRYSQGAAGWARRIYARRAAQKLESYERSFVNHCDMHVTVSDRDRDTLVHRYGAQAPVMVVENGVPFDYFSSPATAGEVRQGPRFRVVFVGSMDYHANIEAVTNFAKEVWPGLRAAAPHIVFTIVGRRPVAAVRALAGDSGVEVTGTVPDVRPYYGEAIAAVIPLRVGGGTRIKILEAMAAGVPVVSSSLGAEGLQVVPGEHYLLADSSAQMLAALQDLLGNPAMAGRLAAAARDLVRRRHDWAFLGDQLARHLLALCGAGRPE